MIWNNQTILLIFVALTGLAVILQAFVLVGILFALKKTAQQSLEVAEDLRSSLVPLAHSTREFLEKFAPQMLTVTANMVDVTQDLREETADLRATTSDLRERVQRQAARMDVMLTEGLDKAEQVSVLVEAAITTPMRQVNGVVQAIKAATERYFRLERRPAAKHPEPDRDMFV